MNLRISIRRLAEPVLFSAFCVLVPLVLASADAEPSIESLSLIELPQRVWSESGSVELMLLIDETGGYTRSRILSSTSETLARHLQRILPSWKFSPARQGRMATAGMLLLDVQVDRGFLRLGVESSRLDGFEMPRVRSALAMPVDPSALEIRRSILRLEIDRSGSLIDGEVIEGDTKNGQLWLREAMANYSFIPAQLGRKPTGCNVIVSLEFDDRISPPRLPGRLTMSLPASLEGRSGEATLTMKVDERGKVLDAEINSATDLELALFARKEVLDWTLEPALRSGLPMSARVNIPFIFNGQQLEAGEDRLDGNDSGSGVALLGELEPESPDLVAPRLPRGAQVVLPAELRSRPGEVVLKLEINENGAVSESAIAYASDIELGAFSRDAVAQWRFRPVYRDGRPTAIRASLPLVFNGGDVRSNAELVDRLPVAVSTPKPKFGRRQAREGGYALVLVQIDAAGEVVGAKLKESSRRQLAKPCLTAAMQWRFTPALKDGLPVPASLVIPFVVSTQG